MNRTQIRFALLAYAVQLDEPAPMDRPRRPALDTVKHLPVSKRQLAAVFAALKPLLDAKEHDDASCTEDEEAPAETGDQISIVDKRDNRGATR